MSNRLVSAALTSERATGLLDMDSPCVNVCVIEHDTGLCTGCRRTLDEIAAWSTMSPRQRLGIMAALRLRAVGTGSANGGAQR